MKNYVYIDYENAGNNIKEYPKSMGSTSFLLDSTRSRFLTKNCSQETRKK